MSSRLSLVLVFVWGMSLMSCGDDDVDVQDAGVGDSTDESDRPQDRPDLADDSSDIPVGSPRWQRPEGYASIYIQVDDSENQTYGDGEIIWNASLIYDSGGNTIEYSSSWLPTQGPFPALYDDGCYLTGGHEAEGQVAGDGIFSAEVFFLAEETTTFEYGLINDLGHWIWDGPNGVVTVQAGETGRIEARGMTFAPFGEIDLRVTLDTNRLHPDYLPFDASMTSVFFKGSMISWRPVQLLDDGNRGDAQASDGIYTFTLSEYLGPHNGLLRLDQKIQFVFVFGGADGLEYKLGGDALANGVSAYSTWDSSRPGEFLEEEIVMLPESAGRALNTSVIIGSDEEPQPVEDTPILRFVEPTRGPTTGGTPVELLGENFANGASVTFATSSASCTIQSPRLITCSTPGRATPGTVPVTVRNPNGESSTHELGFTYVDAARAPQISSVSPDFGTEMGGTQVTIQGSNFHSGASVSFGEHMSASVQFNSAESLVATTPAAPRGTVDVRVRNPDGQTGRASNAFTYQREGIDWAAIQWPTSTISIFQGEALPPLYGRVYERGVTDMPGQGAGVTAQVVFGPSGSHPETDWAEGWMSYSMTYHSDLENDDQYVFEDNPSDPVMDTAGNYDWAVRFSLDGGANWLYGDIDSSANGYSPDQAGSIVVAESSGLQVRGMIPGAIPILGTAEILVSGSGFHGDMLIGTRPAGGSAFSDQDWVLDSPTQLRLSFADPGTPRTLGRWDVLFEDDEHELLIRNAYSVGYVHSPQVDGVINEEPGDWPAQYKLATADIPSNWGTNALHAIYASFDESGLYLAISADLERTGNTLLVYLDTDFGSGSGFTRMSSIDDHDYCCTDDGDPIPADWWRLDRAITSNLDASHVDGFGADFAFGTMELGPEAGDHFINALTGWRKLVAGDNWWFDIETPCTTSDSVCVEGTASSEDQGGMLETFVPWTILYGAEGLPVGGQEIALFARIVNRDGDFISNQSLPVEPNYSEETKWQVTNVLVITVQ